MELKAFGKDKETSKFTLDATIQRQRNKIEITYAVHGGIQALALPSSFARLDSDGFRKDLIWHHTCFEVFLGISGSPEYYEFNFGPNGDWALYHFDRIREGMKNSDAFQAPRLNCVAEANRLLLTAELISVAPALVGGSFDANLTAILELKSGRKLYWALEHPDSRPNFHHPTGYVVRI